MTEWYRFCQWLDDLGDNCLATRGYPDEYDATVSRRCHNSQFLKCVLRWFHDILGSRVGKKNADTHRQSKFEMEVKSPANINQSNVSTRNVLAQCSRNLFVIEPRTTPSAIRHNLIYAKYISNRRVSTHRWYCVWRPVGIGRTMEHQIEQQQQQQKRNKKK